MPANTPRPKPIRLVTDRFLLRTLRPQDVTPSLLAWIADPEVMEPINQRPIQISRERMAGIIASCDGVEDTYIGIFERKSSTYIGNYMLHFDRKELTVTFDVLIGDKSFWGQKVVLETRPVLLDHVFKYGFEKAVGRPPARNFASVFNYKTEGWRLEGILKGQLKHRYGEGRLDQYEFGLLKDEWLAMRKERRDDD